VIRRLLTACIVAAGLAAALQAQTARDWRPSALASFDEVWQTINDTFPDPSFGGLDWAGVKAELRPAAESADSPDAVRKIVRTMLARLHRSHYALMSPSAAPGDVVIGDATVSVDVRVTPAGVLITRVVPDSTAEQAGLRPGSTLLAVDGRPASAWVTGAQGDGDKAGALDVWRQAYRALHGPRDSIATLRVRTPGGDVRDVSVARIVEAGQLVQFGNLPPLRVQVNTRAVPTPGGRRVGVIGFNYWMTSINPVVDDAIDRFRDYDGLLFDLRGNPGGLAGMVSGLAGHVLTTEAVLGRMRVRQNWSSALEFKANPRIVTSDGRRVTPFGGAVAILVDELTASTSECFAGGLQSLGRARVFGRATAGQALPAATKRLTNGDVLMYAIGDFVTSTGRALEGDGVIPDEAQPLDPAALAAGRDTAFEAALRWIDKEKR
jgi:carboxyl-terminal processing protease